MSAIMDFCAFKRMLTPFLIQLLFWISTLAFLLLAIWLVWSENSLSKDHRGPGAMTGLAILLAVVGPIVMRVVCELIIVLFTINSTLTDIRNVSLEQYDMQVSGRR